MSVGNLERYGNDSDHRHARRSVSRVGVVLLAFGEPEGSDPEGVVDFLEGIFLANRRLEPGSGAQRARQLAEARAPGLMEAYQKIGGSPMNAHAEAHARALESALRTLGHEAHVVVGTQFTTPTIADALGNCRDSGVDRLVALPLYPVSGPTTTVAALETVRDQLQILSWTVDAAFIGGWHRTPRYVALRADGIRSLMTERGLDSQDPAVCLYFSAHGTPVSYLKEGSQYQRHVEESCRLIADTAGFDRYELGYQNHSNRAIDWTEPSNEALMPTIEAEHVCVVPLSFIHEQSETLGELDLELREVVEAMGMGFHRVATPHDHPDMGAVLADLVLDALAGTPVEQMGAAS
jgi:ferrochelatase